MADLTDAANALVAAITAIVYPSGVTSPSLTGAGIVIGQGWPDPTEMMPDLAAGQAYINVFPRPGDKVTDVAMGDMEWVQNSNNGTTGVMAREVRRQVRQFQISIWAASFTTRDPLAAAIDAALAGMTRLYPADGSTAILTYSGSIQNDDLQKSGIYRRDLFYSLNYATVQSQTAYAVLTTETNVTGGPFTGDTGPTISIT